jgi:hypothetical protein
VKAFDYVNKTYGVNACVGRRVVVNGKAGTIIEDRGHHIGVNFDTDKPGRALPCHPTWEVQYLEEVVQPHRMTASQRRYQEYLGCDYGQSFAEWMGFGRKRRLPV